jgi:5S rRNA maturation endonuclease (ribonuclease M5)
MYTPSYPSNSSFVTVSKENPCPHCGKPDWCYFIGELSVCNRDQPPATGWEATSKTDKDGKIYYARPQEKKAIRPRQTRYWEYPARDGSPLIRVVRFDDGKGSKANWTQQSWGKCKSSRQIGWIGGTEGVERENIPVYRYAEVRKAIANNELIFIAEGEDNADRFWALGLAATCNIGGSSKWRSSDTSDLQDAKVVIVPDRDEPGIKHAELLHQHFPSALWLYPYPNSKAWENLPKSKGLDVADWVEQHQITAEDIRAAIGEKKVFKTSPQATAKVFTHPKFEARELSGLKTEVRQLLEENLKRSDLTIAIATLSQKYGRPTQEIRSLYQELEHELEQESDLEDVRIGVEQLLASKSASVKLSEIFPQSLADPIEEVARRMNLKPECYALALISGISRFLKNGSSTMLVEGWNRYRCRTFGYFGALIAESSQMKTPIMNTMITDPLAAMREKNQQKFKAQEKAYKEELEQWKNSKGEDKGPAPDAPVETIPYITKATWEGIAGMVGRNPSQGILWLCDELAGFFKSANQYRGGKGSDKEDLLECWSGSGTVVVRAAGTPVNVGAVSLSIYGNIQPKVLEPFLGDGNDDNGTFARFEFVQQPLALTQITLGLPKIDTNPMLQELYERVDTIPMMQFELDEEAKKLFVDYYNHCHRLKFNHPKQGMRAMLGKAAEKVGRVATILHCIHASHLGIEVSQKIPSEHVAAAIKWVEYTTQQALSINTEVCSTDALEGNLAKIISLAERKGGTVTARDVLLSFNPKYRPTSQKIRDWFGELMTMKYGEVTQKGNSILFSLSPTSTVSTVAQSLYAASITTVDANVHTTYTTSTTSTLSEQKHQISEATVDNCVRSVDTNVHTLKSSLDMPLDSSVDSVDVFTPSSKTSQPSMMSCTTESVEPPIALTDNMRSALVSTDREAARKVWMQVKNDKAAQENLKKRLTEEENINVRLLLNCGFIRGLRVRYIGTKCADQYAGLELVVDDIDQYRQITCLMPDGSFTTWLDPKDLEVAD